MPIQFHCNKCQGWIEVDEEHAGGKAICPFCQAVNDVPGKARKGPPARPAEGTQHKPGDQHAEPEPSAEGPQSEGPYTGVPTEPTRPGAPEVPVSKPLDTREKRSRPGRTESGLGRFDAGRAGLPPPPPGSQRLTRIGLLGLAAAIISIVLMVAAAAVAQANLSEPLREQISSARNLTPEQAQDLQKRAMDEFMAVARQKPWIQWLFLSGLLLWITSLVINLSVVFAGGPHRRTYAWAGVLVGPILLFLCLCSGIMQRFMGS